MNNDTSSVHAEESPLKKEDETAGTFHPNHFVSRALLSGLRCRKKEIQT